MFRLTKIAIVCLVTLLFNFVGYTQNQDNYKALVGDADRLLKTKPKAYYKINKVLKTYQKDSVSMRFFAEYFKDKSYVLGESYALNTLGIYCRNTSQYKAAIHLHNEALVKAIKSDNTEMRVIALNMLGVVYRRKDAIRTALDYHYEAVTLAEKVTNPSESIKRSIAVSLNSMGNIFLALNQYNLAVEKFAKSLAIEQEVENTLGLAINYHNIGYAKESLGDLVGALADYKTSLKYNNKIKSKLGQVICHNSIAQIYIKQGVYKKAIDIISSSLVVANDLRDKFHLVGVYNNLGWAYLKLGDYKLSKQYLVEGLEISKAHDFKSSIAEGYTHLSSVSEKEEDYKQALFYKKEAQNYTEEVSNDKNFQYVNDLIIKYDTERINNQIEVLGKENEIVKLKFRKNRSLWIVSCVVLGLLVLLIYILYRQRLLRDEKRILTLEQDILRSQMNPHFVFNSLNSIKQYIIANEKKNAVHYLNKFAKLIRKILEASRIKEVSLAEELETMKLYMSIENIRFSETINFNVTIADTIDLESIKIPSLVLQPFLENALWHGLSAKKGEKSIELSVDKSQDHFVNIKIIDNGIGREQAAIIKENKTIKRKSIGIILTKTRLDNFVKNFKNNYTLTYEDLKKSDGEALGTQVVLKIPVK